MSLEIAASCACPTDYGDFTLHSFTDKTGFKPNDLAMTFGDVRGSAPVLTRIHSKCDTSRMGSLRCDCDAQWKKAMREIAARGRGILIELDQEGRGHGLWNKIKEYALQDKGLDTVDAGRKLGLPDDGRDYDLAARMLRAFNISNVELLTNNPDKVTQLQNAGFKVTRKPLIVCVPEPAQAYVAAKQTRMGHFKV